jgi:hypothetical protein
MPSELLVGLFIFFVYIYPDILFIFYFSIFLFFLYFFFFFIIKKKKEKRKQSFFLKDKFAAFLPKSIFKHRSIFSLFFAILCLFRKGRQNKVFLLYFAFSEKADKIKYPQIRSKIFCILFFKKYFLAALLTRPARHYMCHTHSTDYSQTSFCPLTVPTYFLIFAPSLILSIGARLAHPTRCRP